MADASKILMIEGDAPATPASGTVALYPKTDHAYYTKGSDGVEKALAGTDGDDAYVYVAYASADDGTGFTMTFNAALEYIAILSTATAIAVPAAGDFAGLWCKYKGSDGAGSGDVVGPASSTDNTIARFDGTDNKTIQGSLASVDDSGSVNIPSGQTYKINGSAHTHDYAASDHTHSTYATQGDAIALSIALGG